MTTRDGPAQLRSVSPGAGTPLAGVRVGVTADRRADDQIDLLRRRGATVVHGPTMRIVPLADDTGLAATTRALITMPPDVVVVTTGQGFRGWLEAADGWGLADDLHRTLHGAQLLARGPKARGAIRGSGLREVWSADETESSPEVLDHLLTVGVAGRRIAVQLHGDPMESFRASLRGAGAEVVELRVYRWEPPPDLPALDALIDAVLGGDVDTVTFTSAPSVAGFVHRAEARGLRAGVLDALRGPVFATCVGPVTAAPLADLGVPSISPERFRLGAMVRRLEEHVNGAASPESAVPPESGALTEPPGSPS